MTEQEIRRQELLKEIEQNEAEEKAAKKKTAIVLSIVAAVLVVIVAVGIHYKNRDVTPDVYYLEDGRTIDYNRMRSKIMADGHYDNVYKFKNDYAPVVKNDKMGIVNGHGNLVVPVKYDNVDYFDTFYPGMARITVGDKIGLVDKQGKEVVKPIYDDIDAFTNGLAVAKRDGKEYYIDMNGNEKAK